MDGWNPGNQWIYGRLWFASGNDKVESEAMLPDETIYNVTFTNPNDNNRGYTDTVVTSHQLKAFRNRDENKKNVVVQINQNSNTKTKAFNNDPNNNNPHYIRDGDEIYVLRYQGRIEGYYDGEMKTFPNMSIDISGDIKLKLPENFKTGSGYKFITEKYFGYNLSFYTIYNTFFGYNHINKSYYNLNGQYTNNMVYLNNNDVIYERDPQTGIWYIGLKNKIQVNHISSVNYILEIDEKWNMTLVLYLPDNANYLFSKEWVYGKLVLETGVRDVSKNFSRNVTSNVTSNVILPNTSVITKYKANGSRMQRGSYYSTRPCGDVFGTSSNCDLVIRIKISQTNNTIKYTFKEDSNPNKPQYDVLPVTNLNDFIRIDALMTGYVITNTVNARSINTHFKPQIDYVDRIGIRQPYSNITTIYNTNTDQILQITIPIWEYDFNTHENNLMPNALVNISEALNYEQNLDGSFDVTITRPIRISYLANITYYPGGSKRMWAVRLQIDIDNKWNVTYTYKTPGEAWFDTNKASKNVQGEMRIFVNEVNNTNNSEVVLRKDIGDAENARYRSYKVGESWVLNCDNYTFIGWSDKQELNKTIYYQGNNDNSNKKKFRSLDNLIRFDVKCASYYFIYNKESSYGSNIPIDGELDTSPEYKDKLLENTITLCCQNYI